MITTGIDVTSSARGILFVTNDYAPLLGFSKFFRATETIQNVALRTDWIEYTTNDGKTFAISHTYNPSYPNVLKVQSVNTVSPVSLTNLFDLLYDILK